MNRHPFADDRFEDTPAMPAKQPVGTSAERLMRLERWIEEVKKRGNAGEQVGEQLRQLRREHYRENGSSGG